MRRIALSVAVATTLLTPYVVKADTIQGTAFVSGEWRGAAYDRDRKFSHCAMNAQYRSGITMIFSVSNDWTWRVGWHHKDWKLTPGQSITITLWIDSFSPRQLTATSVRPDLGIAEMPSRGELFDQFRRGYQLTVVAEGREYKFNLEGTNAALIRLGDCVRRQRQIAGLDPPPPPAPPPPSTAKPAPPAVQPTPPARATMEQRLEATKLVANIMAKSEMNSFRLLTDKEIKALDNQWLSEADVVWQAPGLLGILRIVPKGAAKGVDDIAADILGADAKSCKGTFASGFTSDEVGDSAKRMFSACENTINSLMVRYTIVAGPDGMHYVFITTGRQGEQGNREAIDKAEVALRKAVFEVMGR